MPENPPSLHLLQPGYAAKTVSHVLTSPKLALNGQLLPFFPLRGEFIHFFIYLFLCLTGTVGSHSTVP